MPHWPTSSASSRRGWPIPATASDPDQLRIVSQRYRELEPIVAAYHSVSARQGDLAVARELLDTATDDERPHLEHEVDTAIAEIDRLEASCASCCCRATRTPGGP